MPKLYFFTIALFLINSFLYGQHKLLSKERLDSRFYYALGSGEDLESFYESILPNDTVYCMELRYNGYENYLLNCLEAPAFKYIQRLSISGYFKDIPVSISKLQYLTELYIDNGRSSECSIYIPNEIYRLPNLEILSISTGDASISDSIVNLKKLRYLDIASSSLYPYLFTGMPQLKAIRLNDLFNLNKELYKVILNKLVICSHYPRYEYYGSHNRLDANYERIESNLKSPEILNKRIDLKLENATHNYEPVFELRGEIKNNKAEGEWFVKGGYRLKANYVHGERQNAEIIFFDDTTIISTIGKDASGVETYTGRNSSRKTKNNIPVGIWEYRFGPTIYAKISFDSSEAINFKGADTSYYSFFSWKSYKNGLENGIWKEYSGDERKETWIENGKVKKIHRYMRFNSSMPILLREYNYKDDGSLFISQRGNDSRLYKYSEERYKYNTPHGTFLTYFENGNIKTEKPFENGILNGEVKEYFEDKKIKEIDTYKKGVLIHAVSFYQNGKKESEAYRNDLGINGNANGWDENGNLIYRAHYDKGVPSGLSQTFDSTGKVISETYYENGNDIYNENFGFNSAFFFDDRIISTFTTTTNLRKTRCRDLYCKINKNVINDSLREITEYQYSQSADSHLIYTKEYKFKNYKLDGLQILKDSVGNILTSAFYTNGQKNGAFILNNAAGDSLRLYYLNDKIIEAVYVYREKPGGKRTEEYYKQQKLIKKIIYDTMTHEKAVCSSYKKRYVRAVGHYYIPKKVSWIDSKNNTVKTMHFYGEIETVDGSVIRDVKGYVVVNGKLIFLNKDKLYRNIFVEHCNRDIDN